VYSYTAIPTRGGTLHQIEVFDLLKAKKLTKKPGRLLIGKDGRDAKLDFKPAYFTDGMTARSHPRRHLAQEGRPALARHRGGLEPAHRHLDQGQLSPTCSTRPLPRIMTEHRSSLLRA
jgi:hypothetical protein